MCVYQNPKSRQNVDSSLCSSRVDSSCFKCSPFFGNGIEVYSVRKVFLTRHQNERLQSMISHRCSQVGFYQLQPTESSLVFCNCDRSCHEKPESFIGKRNFKGLILIVRFCPRKVAKINECAISG